MYVVSDFFSRACDFSGNQFENGIRKICLKNINFSYDEKMIFKNFNQEFNKGNIYWIKGCKGSGKTTLLNLIIGLYKNKYEGTISYNNRDISFLDMEQVREDDSLIILDEPTLVMNTETKIEFYDYIQTVKNEKIIIIVSNDNIMYEIADQTINLNLKIRTNAPII